MARGEDEGMKRGKEKIGKDMSEQRRNRKRLREDKSKTEGENERITKKEEKFTE